MKLIFNKKVICVFCTMLCIMFTVLCYLSVDEMKNNVPLKKRIKTIKSMKKLPLSKLNPKDRTPLIIEKIVHLDLKGAPPKVSYYSQLFPLLSKLGATGILLEYEDMFPFQGPVLNNISAFNAYTVQEINNITDLAKQHKLKVIPFIQMFGHLDFLLKLEGYAEYREVWNLPSTICPSYNKTLKLLEEIVKQVVDAHPNSNMIHIGCGEVSYLGKETQEDLFFMHDLGFIKIEIWYIAWQTVHHWEVYCILKGTNIRNTFMCHINIHNVSHCERCSDRIFSEQLTKKGLFLRHIRSIIDIIKKKNPALQVLIWDDHFRASNVEELQMDSLFRSFQPVVRWDGKDVYDELGPSLWNIYSKVFPSIWVASAFKGATGSNKYTSDVNHYIQNHKSWLSIIEEYHQHVHFNGIILTGKQRYDHFAVLCELLPVGIPALAMSLRLLQGFKNSALGPPLEVAKLLQCEQPYGLIGSAFGSPKCQFPGGDILENIVHFHQLHQEFDEILNDFRVKGWLNAFNKAHMFSNPQQVKAVLMPLEKIKGELELIKSRLCHSMLEIYDQYTVDEWLTTYLLPFEKQVVSMWETKQNIINIVYWPRRPLNLTGGL